jgi:hypothetical protein
VSLQSSLLEVILAGIPIGDAADDFLLRHATLLRVVVRECATDKLYAWERMKLILATRQIVRSKTDAIVGHGKRADMQRCGGQIPSPGRRGGAPAHPCARGIRTSLCSRG